MEQPKSRQYRKYEELNELLNYYMRDTKDETTALRLGLLMGWMARLAATDMAVSRELADRLQVLRKKSLEDTE